MSRLQSILGGAMLEMPQRLEPERFIFLAPADRGNTAGGCESAEHPNFSPHGRGVRVLFWFRLFRLMDLCPPVPLRPRMPTIAACTIVLLSPTIHAMPENTTQTRERSG